MARDGGFVMRSVFGRAVVVTGAVVVWRVTGGRRVGSGRWGAGGIARVVLRGL